MNRILRLTPLLFLLLLLPACQDQAEAPPLDTAEAERIYGTIHDHHDRLMAQYHQMSAEMPPEMRQRYEEMERLYGEAMPMHEHMMQGHMRGPGMMHGEADAAGMTWEQMHAMDDRLHTLHARMAEDLHAHGYADMAAMHEQMAQYYDEALHLTDEDGS